jgi:hypothetical protein
MKTTTEKDSLEDALRAFHARVRGSAPVAKLLVRWDRLVEVRVLGANARSFFLRSSAGEMRAPERAAERAADVVVVAVEDVLQGIFSGAKNPAREHLDGRLQVFGPQKDQLVLDAIVLLVWGY